MPAGKLITILPTDPAPVQAVMLVTAPAVGVRGAAFNVTLTKALFTVPEHPAPAAVVAMFTNFISLGPPVSAAMAATEAKLKVVGAVAAAGMLAVAFTPLML